MNIKGVNLGNWLVLEKWMSPQLFDGAEAEDEYYLPLDLPEETYKARIQTHRAEYITERDFAIIKGMGLNTVRIPVPYFVFGDCPPYIACVEELDKAFTWAEKYDLDILLDLHTVPYSQNGFDNGGISGVCKWSQHPEAIEFALSVLERLAARYAKRKAFWGIEVINEPITAGAWERMNVEKRYPARDKALAEGSRPNTFEFIQGFYKEAYKRLRPVIPEDTYIVFHDGFELGAWKEFFIENPMTQVVLDTHTYLMIADLAMQAEAAEDYIPFLQKKFVEPVKELKGIVPVICGEWCNFCRFTADDTDFEQYQERLKIINRLQKDTWKEGAGWFYWSYKLLLNTEQETGFRGWQSWDLGRNAAYGWGE